MTHNWQESVGSFFHPRVVTMLFFGFSAGLPILLIFSSLSLWLREAGVEFRVVKNTLLRRASRETSVEVIQESFKGPSGVALSYDDPVAPAKVLTDFAKENENLEIKIGVMDGKVLDLSSIKALSDLPSREVLLGQVLSTMNAVPTGFVRTLGEIPRKMLNVLQAIKEQKEAA